MTITIVRWCEDCGSPVRHATLDDAITALLSDAPMAEVADDCIWCAPKRRASRAEEGT